MGSDSAWVGTRDFMTGRTFRKMTNGGEEWNMFDSPDLPDAPKPPPPVDDISVEGQKQYTKARLKGKKGRASTVLGSANKTGLKTVLG